MEITEEEKLELIEFIINRTDLEKHEEISQRIASDNAYRTEYELLKRIHLGFQVYDVSRKLQEIHTKGKVQNLWTQYIAVAASMFIIAGLFLWQNDTNKIDGVQIYQAYYSSPQVFVNASADIEKEFNHAIELLDQQQYRDAIITLRTNNHPFASWYLALALLHENRVEEATIYLTKLSNNIDSPFQTEAKKILAQIE
jgi:hypothetical protein